VFDDCVIVGSDPGPTSSALVWVRMVDGRPSLRGAIYADNKDLANGDMFEMLADDHGAAFCAYEKCGNQFKCVGEKVFETAAMGGEIRRAFRPHVQATYSFSPSEWRYLLCGQGNAKTPLIYAEICALFEPTGDGADPYKGTKVKPGPLWALHEAGKGGNVEHLKDALGCALALTRCEFRTGEGPEKYRRLW
jgi:hypothetical protein